VRQEQLENWFSTSDQLPWYVAVSAAALAFANSVTLRVLARRPSTDAQPLEACNSRHTANHIIRLIHGGSYRLRHVATYSRCRKAQDSLGFSLKAFRRQASQQSAP
jgi:hypothetical protein